ncbi:MAG: hypothetical protein DRP55_06195 [Spirochaetes bacterium]|nr:MAG: hypothetical protein DRP55_06195 [Spirochaetota bacterium]
MRIYIGTFNEEDADKVVKDLRSVGVKTELRSSLDAEIQTHYFVEGELKKLKNDYKNSFVVEILDEIEESFNTARSVMYDGIQIPDFEENILNKVMPERKNYDGVKNTIKNVLEKHPKPISINKKLDTKLLDEFINEVGEEKIYGYIFQFSKERNFIVNLHYLLKANGVMYKKGKMYGKIKENPYVKVYMEATEDEAEKFNIQREYESFVDKNVDVYANMIDVIYETKRISELCKKKPEYTKLLFMAILVERIIEKVKGKVDLDQLIDEVMDIQEEDEELHLTIDAVNEILKTMEKAEIIKIKNKKIMLRK